jgi:hypothetical protein
MGRFHILWREGRKTNKKKVSGIMLTTFLIITFSITFREVSATETQGVTILTVTNSDSPSVSGSIVYWTFEIIDPDKEAVPGEIVQYSMRVTNLPASDTPLQVYAAWVSFDPGLPMGYGYWDFNIEWPTVAIGETYEGPFGFFTWTNDVPIGYIQGGRMGAKVYYGSPQALNASYTVTIVSPVITATVDIAPDTLNLKSKGKWITCYIELPEGYNVSDVDVSTIMLNDTISAELHPMEIGDCDDDGILDLMVKFDRQTAMVLLSVGEATLTVTGEVDGTPFEGSDTIRVIDE